MKFANIALWHQFWAWIWNSSSLVFINFIIIKWFIHRGTIESFNFFRGVGVGEGGIYYSSSRSIAPCLKNIRMDDLEAAVPYMLKTWDLWQTKNCACFGLDNLISPNNLYNYSIHVLKNSSDILLLIASLYLPLNFV